MFFTDGKLRGLEKFMQLPKYPTKKGGGKYRSSYEYTKGDCNCVNCLHWKKKYGCSQKVCPYIQERIDCGACSFDEILHAAFIDVSNKKLQSRINLYVKESKTMDVKFRNDKHKYALTELLICGECGTPYRRCIWTTREKTKKVVWRCINRLDYGKKYCKHSPSIEESVLQNAIMDAIMKTAKENADVLKTLKSHIAMGLNADSINDNSIELQIRIAEIDAEFSKLITSTNIENENDDDRETLMEKLLTEKNQLKKQLEEIELLKKNKELTMSRLDEIYSTIDLLRNHQITYDDQIVREILDCVVVESKDKIKVVFKGGYDMLVSIN